MVGIQVEDDGKGVGVVDGIREVVSEGGFQVKEEGQA